MIWGGADVIIVEVKDTANIMHSNHLETISPHLTPVCGKVVFLETSPWCQKGWGRLISPWLRSPIPETGHFNKLSFESAGRDLLCSIWGEILQLCLRFSVYSLKKSRNEKNLISYNCQVLPLVLEPCKCHQWYCVFLLLFDFSFITSSL